MVGYGRWMPSLLGIHDRPAPTLRRLDIKKSFLRVLRVLAVKQRGISARLFVGG
jgi:hypothetical protein